MQHCFNIGALPAPAHRLFALKSSPPIPSAEYDRGCTPSVPRSTVRRAARADPTPACRPFGARGSLGPDGGTARTDARRVPALKAASSITNKPYERFAGLFGWTR